MTTEELKQKQINGYHELLGCLQACVIMNVSLPPKSIINKFRELDDKGLLPESMRHYTELSEKEIDLLTQQQVS